MAPIFEPGTGSVISVIATCILTKTVFCTLEDPSNSTSPTLCNVNKTGLLTKVQGDTSANQNIKHLEITAQEYASFAQPNEAVVDPCVIPLALL